MAESTVLAGRTVTGIGAALALLTIACGGDDARMRAEATVDTIGGVVVVRNEGAHWHESERWQVVEEFRVGGSEWGENPDEELSYSQNTTVTLGPNGQIFVLEFAADRVTVFDGEGEFVRSFGRRGEGPGEFSWPMAMTWDGADRLWVGAGQVGRYHVFDSAGVFQKSVARPVHAAASLQHPLVWEDAGSVVEEAAGEGVVLYLRTDTLGNLIDTAAVIRMLERPPALQYLLPPPTWKSFRLVDGHYVPRLRWSRAPDGTIWSAISGELRLVQTTPDGDTLRIIETSHRPAALDAADRAVIAEGLAEAGISRDDVELVRPLVGAIHVMDDGHILVEIIERVGETSSIFDIFDPEGFFMGTIDLGFSLPGRNVPSFVGDTIIAVTPGDLDLPVLVRATIRRPPSDR